MSYRLVVGETFAIAVETVISCMIICANASISLEVSNWSLISVGVNLGFSMVSFICSSLPGVAPVQLWLREDHSRCKQMPVDDDNWCGLSCHSDYLKA